MASHAFWRGYLKLSLVTCAVTMSPATSERDKLRFRTLNRATGNPIESRYVDAESGDVVEPEDQVKGYASREDDYVLMEEEDLDAVQLESTRTIDIEMFVPRSSVSWIWYDTPHYVVPADHVGEEAFAVIRDAMGASGTVGISRLVLHNRERAVLLAPRDNGLLLWTLRFGDEVRSLPNDIPLAKAARPDAKAAALIRQLIDDRTEPWNPDMLRDPVQENLREIIAAKTKAKRRPSRKSKPDDVPQSNVVNIMDALRRSIAADGSRKPKKR